MNRKLKEENSVCLILLTYISKQDYINMSYHMIKLFHVQQKTVDWGDGSVSYIPAT